MSASKVLMIRPVNFGYNEQTATTNYFQNKIQLPNSSVNSNAIKEFDEMLNKLQKVGIEVMVYNDTKEPLKPDAIFPNNWFSVHPHGELIIYPMMNENRRWERDKMIIFEINKRYKTFIDLSYLELEDEFLEGTGSLVIDEESKIAFACLSPRTSVKAIDIFQLKAKYKVIIFEAADSDGKQIYHTNVLLAITPHLAIVCIEAITIHYREKVIQSLINLGKTIVPISQFQMNNFAGNMLELTNKNKDSILVLSQTAFDSLTQAQINILTKYHQLLPIAIPTIERIGGGSVRCMMAELY